MGSQRAAAAQVRLEVQQFLEMVNRQMAMGGAVPAALLRERVTVRASPVARPLVLVEAAAVLVASAATTQEAQAATAARVTHLLYPARRSATQVEAAAVALHREQLHAAVAAELQTPTALLAQPTRAAAAAVLATHRAAVTLVEPAALA
jgi:hypothetical protein